MNLQYRVDLLVRLGEYIASGDENWQEVKQKASEANGWFIPEFLELALKQIAGKYLKRSELEKWISHYDIPNQIEPAKTIGIIMAGNIPLVGFHDLLSVFISGHNAMIKLSSKDEVLTRHFRDKLVEWENEIKNKIDFAPMLKGADAYVATGSNNTSRYFEYYFGKYPNIIRRNRTSVAILDGRESSEEQEKLADDVYLYFGLGCRNVTKLWVPAGYDFIPLLEAFRKYNWLADHHKYKNNYDYNLAILLLNKNYYMTNGSLLIVESPALYSPISQLNYEFYDSQADLEKKLEPPESLQCIVGKNFVPFGKAQEPELNDYADGADTLNFLLRL